MTKRHLQKLKSTETKTCEICQKEYIPYRPNQKYCSNQCRWKRGTLNKAGEEKVESCKKLLKEHGYDIIEKD